MPEYKFVVGLRQPKMRGNKNLSTTAESTPTQDQETPRKDCNSPLSTLEPDFTSTFFQTRYDQLPLTALPSLTVPKREEAQYQAENEIDAIAAHSLLMLRSSESPRPEIQTSNPVSASANKENSFQEIRDCNIDSSNCYNVLLSHIHTRASDHGIAMETVVACAAKTWFRVLNDQTHNNLKKEELMEIAGRSLWNEFFPTEELPAVLSNLSPKSVRHQNKLIRNQNQEFTEHQDTNRAKHYHCDHDSPELPHHHHRHRHHHHHHVHKSNQPERVSPELPSEGNNKQNPSSITAETILTLMKPQPAAVDPSKKVKGRKSSSRKQKPPIPNLPGDNIIFTSTTTQLTSKSPYSIPFNSPPSDEQQSHNEASQHSTANAIKQSPLQSISFATPDLLTVIHHKAFLAGRIMMAFDRVVAYYKEETVREAGMVVDDVEEMWNNLRVCEKVWRHYFMEQEGRWPFGYLPGEI